MYRFHVELTFGLSFRVSLLRLPRRVSWRSERWHSSFARFVVNACWHRERIQRLHAGASFTQGFGRLRFAHSSHLPPPFQSSFIISLPLYLPLLTTSHISRSFTLYPHHRGHLTLFTSPSVLGSLTYSSPSFLTWSYSERYQGKDRSTKRRLRQRQEISTQEGARRNPRPAVRQQTQPWKGH